MYTELRTWPTPNRLTPYIMEVWFSKAPYHGTPCQSLRLAIAICFYYFYSYSYYLCSCHLLGLSLKAELLASVVANAAVMCPRAIDGVSYCLLLIKNSNMFPESLRCTGILEGKNTCCTMDQPHFTWITCNLQWIHAANMSFMWVTLISVRQTCSERTDRFVFHFTAD